MSKKKPDTRLGVFIDTETTGLVKPNNNDFLVQPGLVQIGAVRTDGKEFISFINPELPRAWEEGAIKTHQITPEKVADAPTFFAVFKQFAEFCRGCEYWGGYNVKFDKDVLWYQLLRYGFERAFPWPPEEVEVMDMAMRHMQLQGKRGMKPPKLVEIYEALGFGTFNAHDALDDIKATVRVWEELR